MTKAIGASLEAAPAWPGAGAETARAPRDGAPGVAEPATWCTRLLPLCSANVAVIIPAAMTLVAAATAKTRREDFIL